MGKLLSSRIETVEERFSVEHLQDILYVMHDAMGLDIDVGAITDVDALMSEIDHSVVYLATEHLSLKNELEQAVLDLAVMTAQSTLLRNDLRQVIMVLDGIADRPTSDIMITSAVDRLKQEGSPDVSLKADGDYVGVSYTFTSENLHESMKDAIETYNMKYLNSITIP